MNSFIERQNKIITKAEKLRDAVLSVMSLDEFSSLDAKITIDDILYFGPGALESTLVANLTYRDKLSSDDPKIITVSLGSLEDTRTDYEELILKELWVKN